MKDSEVSSGFLDADGQSGEESFSNLHEIYVSASGFERLFRCQRYSRLHILKTLKPEYVGNAFYEQALRKEFDIAYQLEHPHICRALGWETLPGLGHCIVLEYIDGVSLKEFMESGQLTPLLARKFITELCDALNYLHRKQIVHRDLKPENVLITHNGNNVKLIDFGLSDCDNYDALKIPAGTRYYIAPEALKVGQPLNLRADIYSLGIMIGEMAECLKDNRLAEVSRKCTRRKPEERYASALEVIKALEGKSFLSAYYRWIGVACIGGILLALAYMVYEERTISSPMLPVYGNYSLSESSWKYLKHGSDGDSLSFAKRQEVLHEEFPLAVQQQTANYQKYQNLEIGK